MDQNQNQNENLNQNQQQQYQPTSDINSFAQEFQAPVYANEFRPIKKKINPVAIVLPVSILIAAAAVVLFIILFSNRPDYRKAEESYFSNFYNALASSSEEAKKELENPEKLTVEVDTTLDRVTGVDLSKILLEMNTASKEGSTYADISFSMDDLNLNVESWINTADSTIHLFLPEISDIYAKIDFNKALESDGEYSFDEEKILKAYSDILSKTAETYFELVGEAKPQQNQEFYLEGKSFKADKVEIHLDSKQIAQLVEALIKNIGENEDFIDFISEASGEDADFIKDSLTDINSEIEDIENSGIQFAMTVYMKKNVIVGREIKLYDNKNDAAISIYNVPTDNGNLVSFSISSESDEEMQASFLLEDSKNGDAHSGEAKLVFNDNEINASYEDLAVTDTLFRGKINLSLKNEPAFAAEINLKTEGENKIAELKIPNICNVTITSGPSDISYKELPNVSEDKIADITSDNSDGTALMQLIQDISEYFAEFAVPDEDNAAVGNGGNGLFEF